MGEMYAYKVGELYHQDRTVWEERTEYNFREGGHELRIFMAHLTAREIADVRFNEAEFGLFVQGDILLFLYRFGRSIPWGDAPYSWHLVPPEGRTLPEPAHMAEPHLLLTVFLVEATTGILKAIRQLTFSPAFGAALSLAILEQSQRPWPGGRGYDMQLGAVYTRYPRSSDLLKDAIARTRGGA